jgi:hypothetical protein
LKSEHSESTRKNAVLVRGTNNPGKSTRSIQAFANHFKNKVGSIIEEVTVDNSIYNGKQKIIPEEI